MANQDVRVSALQSASTLSTDDLALATVVDELSETGYTSKKITEGAKASQYLEAFTFANLNTSAKTIVGAINEAATTGGSDEFIIHMTDTTVTETAADIIDAFDNGSEIWLESQITGETTTARLPLLAYISDSSQLVLRFSGITYANNRYRYCDVQMLRSPEQIVGRQSLNVTFAVIDDATTSSSSVWSSQKTASELASKAEIDDTAVNSSTAWSSSQIVSLLPTESASGAVASFETPLTLPLVSHNVTIEPVQAGTGDPSPSNPRAISGWSAVNVTRTGKNLLPTPTMTDSESWTVVEFQGAPNTTYTMSSNVPSESTYKMYFKTDNSGGGSAAQSVATSHPSTQTSGADGKLYWNYRLSSGGSWSDLTDLQIQIELGSTATTYEPYNGTTVTIDLDGTVYRGELDVTSGVLTKTFEGVDLSTLNWSTDTNTHRATSYSLTSQIKKPAHASQQPLSIAEEWKLINYGATLQQGDMTIYSDGRLIAYYDGETPSGKFCYELATPVEITLTPEQINTLKGVNNIWADTGDTAIEFKQDIQTYIDSRLSSGTRTLSLAKSPVETEETKQEEQEGDENVDR